MELRFVKYFSGKRRPSDPNGGPDPSTENSNGSSQSDTVATSRFISSENQGRHMYLVRTTVNQF